MTIKQLLEMPIGQKTGGFELTVKKYPSKMVEVGKKKIQPVMFIDETGEMLGDVLNAKFGAIHKGYSVHITVGIIQNGEKGKKLYVEQWWLPTMSMAEYEAKQYDFKQEIQYGEPLHIVKSKVKMHVVCALLNREKAPTANDSKMEEYINAWVDFIVTGE